MKGRQQFGGLLIDIDAHRVLLDGDDVRLTRSEFALLLALSSAPKVALSNREILEAMWGSSWQADTTPLQVHVSRLRRKLEESGAEQRYIVTVHGFGYRFDPAPTGSVSPHHVPELRTVVLDLDQDFILQDVEPPQPFLGWQVEDVIGTFFSPTGLDPVTLRSVAMTILATGLREMDGQIQAFRADGTAVEIRAHTRIKVDDKGTFTGLSSTLYLPDD